MGETKFRFGQMVEHVECGLGVVIEVDTDGLPFLVKFESRCERWCTADELTTPTPPPNTVPVRIAVAVDEGGRWAGIGRAGWSDTEAEDDARFALQTDRGRVSWVTAHVPLPEQPAEIEGFISKGDSE